MLYALLLCMPGQIELVPARDFSRAVQEKAVLATVRITNKATNADGTGVIVRQSGPAVYLLTAQHLVDKADKLDVATFSLKSYPRPEKVYTAAEVVAQLRRADLALVRILTRDPLPGPLRICPLDALPTEKSFAALSVGCDDAKAPTSRLDAVNGRKRVRKPNGDASSVWEVNREPSEGRSGGPLVDKHGNLLGICSGRNDGKGYYTHVEEVYSFLKQNGFLWLLKEEKE